MDHISYKDSLFRGNIYRSIDIAGSGMTAQRKRMDAISSNIANMSVTNVDGNGNPYLRKHVVMEPDPEKTFSYELKEASIRLTTSRPWHISEKKGTSASLERTPLVAAEETEIPNKKMNVVYDPSHPDADEDGYVTYPDINILQEMTDMMIAGRVFEANVTVVNAAKSMISQSLDL